MTENKDLVTRALQDPEVIRDMEYEWFVDEIIVKIEQAMEKQDMSRTDLANKLQCSPANVTQLLRHGSNLTLKSLVDIALALEHRFIAPDLVPMTEAAPWESCEARPVMIVYPHSVEAEGFAFSSLAWPELAREERAKLSPYTRQTGEFHAVE
jgi:DNA-binding Xre family transcriptional regulator